MHGDESKADWVHKGVTYFGRREDAESERKRIAADYPGARIADYVMGYAVQLHASGPYLGPGLTLPHSCVFCPVRKGVEFRYGAKR